MKFEELYNTNVNAFIEQKGKFNYLSWTYAVKELKKAFPDATYQQVYNNNSPYFKDDSGCYIKIKLWLTKEDRKEDFYQDFNHPVLDNQNKPILNPNSFQVNTSFMRGLTKLIGMTTGIGLYIYTGEDLPVEEPTKAEIEAQEKAKEENKNKKVQDYYNNFEKKLQEISLKGLFQYIDYAETFRQDFLTKKKENLVDLILKSVPTYDTNKPERQNEFREIIKKEGAMYYQNKLEPLLRVYYPQIRVDKNLESIFNEILEVENKEVIPS